MSIKKTPLKKSTLRQVILAVGKHRMLLILSMVCALLYVVFSLLIPLIAGSAVDIIVGAGRVDFDALAAYLVLIIACAALGAGAQYVMTMLNNRVTYLTIRTLRERAFGQITHMPLKTLDAHPYGETISRVMADVDQFADGLLLGFSQLFTGVMTILGTLIFMFTVNASIMLVVVLITPLSLLTAAYIAKNTHKMFKAQSAARADQTATIDEMISGQKIVAAFTDESAAFDAFDKENETLRSASMRATFFSSITNPATRFVNALVYAGVGLFGALAVVKGGMTVGQLSCFLSYANQYTKPFNEISGVITELQNALVCFERVMALINTPHEVEEAPKALKNVQGHVALNDISFSYTRERPLLENISLDVAPGQRIALVGPTGCGKTTLINLLMRFYDVNSGEILVDGTPISDVTRRSLRQNFGMVLQDTWLRSGTIAQNIAFGKPDASREEVVAAAKQARAHSFIKRLPDGYDTLINEEGGALSQGQKQLLCIARVMLCLPPMLILDEATSSIDTRTEMRIQEAFSIMMKGRTSFVVAHRLSTIKSADVILVMKDGNIIEHGSHEALLEEDGFYATLYRSQTAALNN